jgi:hypothetical protein
MMSGPFSRLMDTNSHYSIQLEIYRYLMGAVGRKVKTNDLWLLPRRLRACSHDPDEDLGYYRRRAACKI